MSCRWSFTAVNIFVLQEAASMKYKLVAGSENGQSEHNLQREDHHLALK